MAAGQTRSKCTVHQRALSSSGYVADYPLRVSLPASMVPVALLTPVASRRSLWHQSTLRSSFHSGQSLDDIVMVSAGGLGGLTHQTPQSENQQRGTQGL